MKQSTILTVVAVAVAMVVIAAVSARGQQAADKTKHPAKIKWQGAAWSPSVDSTVMPALQQRSALTFTGSAISAVPIDPFAIRLFDNFYPVNVQDGKIQIGNSKFYKITGRDTSYAIEASRPVQILKYIFECHKERWEEDLKLQFNGNDWTLISFEVKKPVPDVVYNPTFLVPGQLPLIQQWPEHYTSAGSIPGDYIEVNPKKP